MSLVWVVSCDHKQQKQDDSSKMKVDSILKKEVIKDKDPVEQPSEVIESKRNPSTIDKTSKKVIKETSPSDSYIIQPEELPYPEEEQQEIIIQYQNRPTDNSSYFYYDYNNSNNNYYYNDFYDYDDYYLDNHYTVPIYPFYSNYYNYQKRDPWRRHRTRPEYKYEKEENKRPSPRPDPVIVDKEKREAKRQAPDSERIHLVGQNRMRKKKFVHPKENFPILKKQDNF